MRRSVIGWILASVCLVRVPAQETVGIEGLKALEAKVLALRQTVAAATVGLRIEDAQGSGVVVTQEGLVLTAAHCFDKPGLKATVLFGDGRTAEATSLGRERNGDYGLLRLDEAGPWPCVAMAPEDSVTLHQPCFALGHPGGFDRRRAAVFRFGRITSLSGQFLRSSCVIDQGDSGGPLFDFEGRVIGIHSRIMPSPTANYHVPIDRWHRAWKRLVAGEDWAERLPSAPDFSPGTILGVSGRDHERGCLVLEVHAGRPAETGGLQRRDVVTIFDGTAVEGIDHLTELIRKRRGGDLVEVVVLREGKRTELQVVLDEFVVPADPFQNGRLEKSLARLLERVGAPVAPVRDKQGRTVALATAFAGAGGLLTKASELPDEPFILDADGNEWGVRVLARDDERDLALIEAPGLDLPGLNFDPTLILDVGRFLVAPLGPKRLAAQAAVAVAARRIRGATGFLGVMLGDAQGGALIQQVTPDSAAEAAGVHVDDIVLSIDGVAIDGREALIEKIGSHSPGARVKLRLRRAEAEIEIEAQLGAREAQSQSGGRRGGRFRGPARSDRRADFASVVQIDAVLGPQDCGGPVFDLDGNFRGLVIARADRTETYVLPPAEIQAALARFAKNAAAASEAK